MRQDHDSQESVPVLRVYWRLVDIVLRLRGTRWRRPSGESGIISFLPSFTSIECHELDCPNVLRFDCTIL